MHAEAAPGKAKAKGAEKLTGKQTTLQFGKKLNKPRATGDSQRRSASDETDTQETEIVMVAATQVEEERGEASPQDDDPITEDQEVRSAISTCRNHTLTHTC